MDEKYEFCSKQWVAFAKEYLQGAAVGEDLSGVSVTFNEVFTDAPSHLDPDDEGRIGWYLRVENGNVEVERGILDQADLTITVDYTTILPLARMVFEGNPEGVLEAQETMVAAAAAGKKMKREGNDAATASLSFMGGLHDALAQRTA